MVLAPNPSPMTNWGTNTYLLGRASLAVIDPGPDDDAHFTALQTAIGETPVTHILLTHTHLDHSPLANRLSKATGAPVYAFGTHLSGRSKVMAQLAADGLAGGGEGIDQQFVPDQIIQDGDIVQGDDWALTAVHTPGHIANHLSFVWDRAVFTGDHVMGWASSLVSPPDGDLTQFMASCVKLQRIPADIYYAGHGAPIEDPHARLDWLIAHRLSRETEILAALRQGLSTIDVLTDHIYADAPSGLRMAASRNVFAHLIDLEHRGLVLAQPQLSMSAAFTVRN